MNIWMTARATGNPYITLLIENIEAHGHTVRETEPQWRIARDLLLRNAPDVLHVHWLYLFFLRGEPSRSVLSMTRARGLALFFDRLLAALKERGTKIVWTAHNLHNHEKRKMEVDRKCHEALLPRADAIIAHSQSAKEMIVEAYSIDDAEKVRVIPHGHYIGVYPEHRTRDEARRELGIEDGERAFVYFGKIRPYKNIPRLIDAFSDLCERSNDAARRSVLVIAGRPSSEELDGEIRRRIGTRTNIRYQPKFIPDEDVELYMKAADAVVLPYRDILTSGAAVLAMSFGRPVIGPRLGTLRDVLEQQPELLYEPSEDERAALDQTLEATFMMEEEALEAIGTKNLERARQWDWPKIGRLTTELYEDLASGYVS